jgi:hypothetical protein
MKIQSSAKYGRRLLVAPLFLCGLILLCFAGFGTAPSTLPTTNPTIVDQPAVNAAIAEFEPALAVRAAACITCHAKIGPGFITDFGYGDRYFFGKPGGGTTFGPFNGHIYGDFYGGEPDKTGWLTAEIEKQIIVPQAGFDFDLSAAGAKLAGQYPKTLQAKSLADYLRALESQKQNPATVIEKKRVFIGAPSAATLESRFQITPGSGVRFKYIKSGASSPEITGIDLSPGKDFYTNISDVVCDGDLFIGGSLFLDRATISTQSGCRIYATGSIFVQNAITYKNLGGSVDKTNLQLVSAEAILMGVGDKSCDAASKDSPLSRRLVSGYAVSTFLTREADRRSISPQAFGESIYAQGKRITVLEDAGCHNDTLGFSRLLLNAPQVHNRYKGQLKGLVIAEFALFRLSKSSFEFDPVFKQVPILPLLKDSDYLQVQ